MVRSKETTSGGLSVKSCKVSLLLDKMESLKSTPLVLEIEEEFNGANVSQKNIKRDLERKEQKWTKICRVFRSKF
jgi:hypothetical protein